MCNNWSSEFSSSRALPAILVFWHGIPVEWKSGVISALYKGKDRRNVCSSHRLIALLSVPGKVFAHVYTRSIESTTDTPPESNASFRSTYAICSGWLNSRLTSDRSLRVSIASMVDLPPVNSGCSGRRR